MQKQKPVKKASTRRPSHETVYICNLKACVKDKDLLRANRPGLVALNNDHDKQMFAIDELTVNVVYHTKA